MDDSTRRRIRSEISYEELTPGDLPLLARLIDGMRQERDDALQIRDYSPDYYHWMYFRNPAGPAVVYAGKHEGRLVTSFAMTPKRVQFGDEVILCGKTMDMFTDPAYQGLGMINEVTTRVFGEARRRGIYMWYVTPSKNSYPIFKDKWNYFEPFQVNYVVKILDYSVTLGAAVRLRLAGLVAGSVLDLGTRLRTRNPTLTFRVSQEQAFGHETDDLWARSHGYGVALVRDATYMTWRYIDNPDRYEISKFFQGPALRGILVTKLTRRRGIKVGEIVDVVAAPADAEVRRAMLGHALSGFRDQGCAIAQAWAIENCSWEGELRAAGIGRRRRKMAFLLSPDAPRPAFHDASSWFLTQGDGNDL